MGASITPGKKDKMLSLFNSEPYQCKIHAASQMHVVLYDTEARRGWLVDGANALIHLCRTQVARKPYSDNPLIVEKFPHTVPRQGPGAALKALSDIATINQTIYEDPPVFGQYSSENSKWGLKDIVLQNWHLLEQMQDYQTDLCGPGMPIRISDRDRLEGFGFLDMISGKSTIRPRFATLDASGRGWVDFTRQIAAVTLMARGFGDIIRPTESSNALCTTWNEVPRGMDYLAATIAQLQEICDEIGHVNSKRLELVQGLYWHQGGELFKSCCDGDCSPLCDRVQVLLPELSSGADKPPVPFTGNVDGAVIFGHSKRIPKWWPKNSKLAPVDSAAECLKEDSMPISLEASQSLSLQDSGLGSSVIRSDEVGTSSSGNLYQSPSSNTSVGSGPDETVVEVCSNSKAIMADGRDLANQATSIAVQTQITPKSRKGKEPVRIIDTPVAPVQSKTLGVSSTGLTRISDPGRSH